MESIRQAIEERSAEAAKRLLETRLVEASGVVDDPEVIANYDRLRKFFFIGGQYKWIARYVRQFGLTDLELCIHRDDKAHAALSESTVYVNDDCGGHYRVGPHANYPTDLFNALRFPIFELTKVEMQEEARRRAWTDIMELTWFCHQPTPDGKACGVCPPCVYTREEGMGHRIAAENRSRQPTLLRRTRVLVRDALCAAERAKRRLIG